jgi:hypothetical protein
LERDRRANLPVDGEIQSMAMGAASDGPLMMIYRGKNHASHAFIDAETTNLLSLEVVASKPVSYSARLRNLSAADSGSLFCAWAGVNSGGQASFRVFAGKVTVVQEAHQRGHAVPGPLGERIYSGVYGPLLPDLTPAPNSPPGTRCCLPSSQAAYYLGLSKAGPHRVQTVLSIYGRELAAPLLSLPPTISMPPVDTIKPEGIFPYDKRCHLVPQLNLLAIVPTGCHLVRIYKVDIQESLRARGIDYLFVTSSPPRYVKPGGTYRYLVKVAASAKSVSYALDACPPGMTVSPSGEVLWNVPADASAPGGVIIHIKGSDGQSTYHTFQLRLAS